MLLLIFKAICWILFLYLAISTVYLLVLAIAGKLYPNAKKSIVNTKKNIAVLIPSYKEDHIIIDTATLAAAHDYPSNHFSVFVVADQLQESTQLKLQSIPNVHVIAVNFVTSTKARSIDTALQIIQPKGFDIVMILDADNVMSSGCLEQVNTAFHEGFKVVQCHRTAKNEHTPVALLDAISEEINNNLFRSGQRFLGLPSAIIGSGMAFETNLIAEIFSSPQIHDNPGEDREIDVALVKKDVSVAFLKGVYVYDEKVPDTTVFQKQRVRWMEAQITHIKLFMAKELAPKRGNKVFINKFFQCFLLPRLLYLALCFGVLCFLLIEIIFNNHFLTPPSIYWWVLIIAYGCTLLISVPVRYYSFKTVKALAKIPSLLVAMIKSILQMKTGRKEFIHTPKSFTGE